MLHRSMQWCDHLIVKGNTSNYCPIHRRHRGWASTVIIFSIFQCGSKLWDTIAVTAQEVSMLVYRIRLSINMEQKHNQSLRNHCDCDSLRLLSFPLSITKVELVPECTTGLPLHLLFDALGIAVCTNHWQLQLLCLLIALWHALSHLYTFMNLLLCLNA